MRKTGSRRCLADLHRGVMDLQAQQLPSLLLEEHRIYLWWLLAIIAMIVPAHFRHELFAALGRPWVRLLLARSSLPSPTWC